MENKTSLSQYFSEVDGDKLLTKEEELKLAKAVAAARWYDQDGNVNRNKLWRDNVDTETLNKAKKAREILINSNLRLVASVAKKYQNKGCPLEDLIQEGNIGLMDGIDKFDYKKNFKISTYCHWWIRQRIDRHISNAGRTVRVPVHVQALAGKLKKMVEEFQLEFGTMPDIEEISESLDCSEDMARAALQAINPNPIITIDYSNNEENEGELKSYLEDEEMASPSDIVSQQELISTIKEVIKTLPERDEKILRLRFGIVEDEKDHNSWPITNKELNKLKERALNNEQL